MILHLLNRNLITHIMIVRFIMQKQKDISFYGMFSAVENVYTEGYMYEFEKSIRKTILVR